MNKAVAKKSISHVKVTNKGSSVMVHVTRCVPSVTQDSGFDVTVRVGIRTRGGDAPFEHEREFWVPGTHEHPDMPKAGDISIAADTLAETLAALWAAGYANYRIKNWPFLRIALDTVPVGWPNPRAK